MGDSRFDHGAQFCTVRDARFREAFHRWEVAGWVAPWFTEDGHVRYRASGGMNTLAQHLAKPLDVRVETKVELVEPIDQGWLVITEKGESFRAGALLLTPPLPQSTALLTSGGHSWASQITAALNSVVYDPCFALLVIIDGPGRVPPPGYIRLDRGPVEWIADNTQKGVSTGTAALTIHARADFSLDHLEWPKEDVARLLFEAAEPWLGARINAWQLHRWRYSRPVAVGGPMYFFSDQPARLAIAGDAFGGPNVEGAFLSGLSTAERIAQTAS
jgi:predicted NAD/FAD-dependent oxidoreductase